MPNQQPYRSEALKAIHGTMKSLHRIGAIDKITMREFDDACLAPVQELTPEDIRALREHAKVSQPVFASWERGKKKPGGPALKLLNVIQKHGLEAIA
jgi:putative transcriptional regulator